ncbi:MAG: hypothetical protein OHK0046_27180 [Anaerolineae bacterium]
MHHTKTKGDLAVAKVIADLATYDIYCTIPFSEHLAFDVIAVSPDQTRLCRLQIKYRAAKRGAIQVPLRTSWADRNGSHENTMDYGSCQV